MTHTESASAALTITRARAMLRLGTVIRRGAATKVLLSLAVGLFIMHALLIIAAGAMLFLSSSEVKCRTLLSRQSCMQARQI